jgi:hypothetical protein
MRRQKQKNIKWPNNKRLVGFVAISFRNEQDPALIDYYNAMLRSVARTKLPINLNRIDCKEGDYEISQQIMHEIKKCDFILADFTLNSHNVYFEVGFGRAIRKKIIQTAKADTPLQFDVRNWKTIFYRNATELEEKLIPVFRDLYQDLTA